MTQNRDDGILGAALGPAAAQTMLRRSRGTPAPDTARVDGASAVSHWFGDLLR